MAIDTAAKRQSASTANIGTNLYGQGVKPSGTIGPAARQAVVNVYGGILATTPVLVLPSDWRTYRRPRRR